MRRSVALCLLLAACDQTAQLGVRESPAVSAAAGGTVSGDGISMKIPPGALSADTQVTLSAGTTPVLVDPPAAGPIAVFAPIETQLLAPAQVEMPITLHDGQSAADLVVLVIEPGGHTGQVPHTLLTIDGNVVRFQTMHLGTFEPAALMRCPTEVCSNGWTCTHEECHP